MKLHVHQGAFTDRIHRDISSSCAPIGGIRGIVLFIFGTITESTRFITPTIRKPPILVIIPRLDSKPGIANPQEVVYVSRSARKRPRAKSVSTPSRRKRRGGGEWFAYLLLAMVPVMIRGGHLAIDVDRPGGAEI